MGVRKTLGSLHPSKAEILNVTFVSCHGSTGRKSLTTAFAIPHTRPLPTNDSPCSHPVVPFHIVHPLPSLTLKLQLTHANGPPITAIGDCSPSKVSPDLISAHEAPFLFHLCFLDLSNAIHSRTRPRSMRKPAAMLTLYRHAARLWASLRGPKFFAAFSMWRRRRRMGDAQQSSETAQDSSRAAPQNTRTHTLSRGG